MIENEYAFQVTVIVRVQKDTEDEARRVLAAVFAKGEIVKDVEATMVHVELVKKTV